jgi:hypothetical protein
VSKVTAAIFVEPMDVEGPAVDLDDEAMLVPVEVHEL